ncbi:YeeE/YedE family protein [Notoacmeibacter sp. MSK16QG-6]|uniref:YeeE/YedE family protein n=1 Tax=Notoacmeibacter sp. MSK16QG-6 TaxID=2957982 RepID=UPI00209E1FDF|nr:YeeE/YedE family protein [Notoacmeibacter sp. MSK16QG-6]MCP1200821.1 YeeE/YedE family protein [Notoacmeibacter sp. MSK16QG-6]
MDFVPLIDTVGEPATAAIIGLGLGAVFGIALERSGFCTRSAAIELFRNTKGRALPIWLIGFALCVALVQAMIWFGVINVGESRFFATPQSLSGAIVGGALFGIGMALARGCASRLVVLGATGNLRAIFTILVIAGTAWATFQGPLVPLRDAIGSLLSSAALGGNDISALSGLGDAFGPVFSLALIVAAAALAVRRRLSPAYALGGAVAGATVAFGWYATYQFSGQVFDPVQPESLSYMRPLANTLNFLGGGGAVDALSTDVGIIAGTIAGAFLSALAFRNFRIQTFAETGVPSIWRYAAGGVLMGFGGILAVGCTIGAGFTGGSVLAATALVGLAMMILFAGLTDLVLGSFDKRAASRKPAQLQPAE